MSKFLHPSTAGNDAEGREAMRIAAELVRIQWPAEPWACPACRRLYASHAEAATIATLDAPYERPEETVFRCFVCDIKDAGILPRNVPAFVVPIKVRP